MLDQVKNFLFEYFWLPIIDQSVHYNIYNTTVYALLFAIAAVYLVFPMVKRMGLSFDRNFFVAITPYVFLGGITRSLRDLGIVDTFLLETPIIYVLMFFLVVVVLYSTNYLQSRNIIESYWKYTSAIGILLLLIVLGTFITQSQVDVYILAEFTILLLISSGLLAGAAYLGDKDLVSYEFLLPVIAHFADSSSTVVALDQGAEEKHVLANFFIDIFGPYGMFIMKALVIVPVTYYILKEFEGEKRNYYLFLVALLGIALATRNMTSITFSV